MPSVRIVINPCAGDGDATAALEMAESLGYEVIPTAGPGDASRLAREAAREGIRVVVAAGGDGTVHEVVQGLLSVPDHGTALGVLPLGTGNDLARNLGIPMDIESALEGFDGPEHSIDVIRVRIDGTSVICLNALNGGISGQVSEAVTDEIKEGWGRLSYLRAAADTLDELHPYRVRIETADGEPEEHAAYNVAIANGPRAGGGIPIAPEADPSDGLADVVLIRPAPIRQLAALLPAVLSGSEPESELFISRRLAAGRITVDPPLPYSLDGEPGEGSEFEFEVLPSALRVRGADC